MTDEPEQPPLRLDPDEAAARAARLDREATEAEEAREGFQARRESVAGGGPGAGGGPAAGADEVATQSPLGGTPAIDTRPYRWAVGGIGIALVIVISVVLFLSRGLGTVGVPPGQRLHNFAAPVATSNLLGDPNFSKPCALGYLAARAVNTCLITRREPLVLAFFVTGSSECVQEVDAMQRASRAFAPGSVAFAAVAVRGSKSATAKLVHAHHWSLPVAYDRDGTVGAVYSVEICPLLELASRGGVVKYRLIGSHWLQSAALAAKVRALVG